MGIESYLYSNHVEAVTVWNLAVNALVNNECPELTGHLLNAWWAFVDEDEVDLYESPQERYADYKRHYEKACFKYRVLHGDDDFHEPDWPKGVQLPRDFVRIIATIEGQREKQSRLEMNRIHNEIERDKVSMTPEEFKSKWGFNYAAA
jgi:hypothetical protein